MKFVILSKSKIDAVESNLTDFIAEDLLGAIQDNNSIILALDTECESFKSLDQFSKFVGSKNTEYKYKYEITVKRKEI